MVSLPRLLPAKGGRPLARGSFAFQPPDRFLSGRSKWAFHSGRSTTHSQRRAHRVMYSETRWRILRRQKQKIHYAPPIHASSCQRHLHWRRLGPRPPHCRYRPSASLKKHRKRGECRSAFSRIAAVPILTESLRCARPNSSACGPLRGR